MTIDARSGPSSLHTYRGFSGPPPTAPASAAPAWRRKGPALVASACALGLAVGIWAKPQWEDDGRAREPIRPVAAAPLDGERVQIVVDPPKAAAAAGGGGQLEVLPPEMAAAAGGAGAGPPPQEVSVAAEAPAPLAPPEPLPRLAEVSRPTPVVRPSFDCRSARTPSERMVCQDPSLAAADRRLARAFRRASEAGIPYDELRGEQDDWISIREAAARRSPEAVASIYDQRIDELEAMAEDYPDP